MKKVKSNTSFLNEKEVKVYYTIVNKVREFYLKNDEAHQLDHGLTVLNNLLNINDSVKYTDNILLLLVTALYHDIFSNKEDRAQHHILAAEYVLKDKYIDSILSIEDKLEASRTIREHRASFKGIRSGTLSDMLSTADIGSVNLRDMILRSMKYNDGNKEDVIKHLKEKFGYGGYVNYSDLYKEIYKEELTKLKDDIESLHLGVTDIDVVLGLDNV